MATDDLNYSDDHIRQILSRVRTIAMVGASANWNRPSYFAMKYLLQKGYQVIPVNPGHAGKTILEQPCYKDLTDLPVTVDMVDVFRNATFAVPIVEAAVAHGAKVVWMQLGIRNDEAAAMGAAAGLTVIMNRCPKIEYARLYGELSCQGAVSGVVSSRRRPCQSDVG